MKSPLKPEILDFHHLEMGGAMDTLQYEPQ